MNSSKIILVASDLSEQSALALGRAAQLAQALRAQLELLHVVEASPIKDLPAPLRDALGARALQQIEEAHRQLERQAEQTLSGDIAWQCRVETGKDFVAIIRGARQSSADLIVLGAHGSHALRDLFLGTTAEKVVRKADRPVLVVKKPTLAPYRRVLVATDFSVAARQALLVALPLAPEARFDLLHVQTPWGEGLPSLAGIDDPTRQRYQQQLGDWVASSMTEWLRGIAFGAQPCLRHVRQGRPGILIPQLAEELGADLLVMGSAGLSGLASILLGSVAEHVLRAAPCDLLLARPRDFHFELP
ncbi:MAG: universal stress protein [Trichloromonadaceae bacterium]